MNDDPQDQTTIAKNEIKTDFSVNQNAYEQAPSPVIEPQFFDPSNFLSTQNGNFKLEDKRVETYSTPQSPAQNQAPTPFPGNAQSPPPEQEVSIEEKIASINAWLKSLPSGPPEGISALFGNNKPAEAEKFPPIFKQTSPIGSPQKSGSIFDAFRERMAKKVA
jgi:hypothetical protein